MNRSYTMIVKNLRLKHGLSQEQLASMTHLSTRTIQRIEKDDTVSIESLNLLAKVFNMDTQELQMILEERKNDNIAYDTKQVLCRKKINQKVLIFVLVNLMLFTINMITNAHHWWFLYPLFGWGTLLIYKSFFKHKLKTLNII